jgi:putative membrane-bound dehydrogenase-like protein
MKALLSLILSALPAAAAESLKPPSAGQLREGLAPAEALAAFTAYEGFQVETVAAEPDVRQPVAMTIDARGRLWVAEAFTYPTRAEGETGEDRILIFEDADGDGAYESRKVFTEGLNLVSGLEVGFGGVWVGAAPYLLFIPDRDGNDQPDGPPEKRLDGWGWQDTHETLNSFIWGPDGWLYGCHGVFTHSKVGKPGTPDEQRVPINAGVWRYHPLSEKFEVFAHGTSNPWGVDFNDHGQAFVTACVIPHLYHIIQGGRYQRQAGQHFHKHTYDDLKTIADHLHFAGNPHQASRDGSASDLGGGHAHCGLSIYLGDNFPPQFRNGLLFNNLHGHRINHDAAVGKGSGYVGQHRPDFLFANDKHHMGIALRYGPDGGLFLIDWYDRQLCHHTLQEAWDRSNGRIYKISYGKPQHRRVDLDQDSDLQLVRHHLHANDWFVRTARRVLQERHAAGKTLAGEPLAELTALLQHDDDTRRLRALWTLHAIEKIDSTRLVQLMTEDASEHVRAWAIQLLNEGQATDDAIRRMTSLAASDPSPHVRLYLAAALQRMPLEKRPPLAAALLSHAEDAEDHNLPLMLWYGVSDLAEGHPQAALDLALGSKIPLVRRFLVRRLCGDEIGRENILAAASDPSAAGALTSDLLAGMSQALADARSLPAPPSWHRTAKLFDQLTDPADRRNFERIATVFGDARMKSRFRTTLADAAAPAADRTAALDNLRRMEDKELPRRLLHAISRKEEPMRTEWLQALGTVQDDAVASKLVELLPSLSPPERQAAVVALTTSADRSIALAQALAGGVISRSDISAFAARQMRAYDNASVNSVLEEHWGMIAVGSRDKAAETERLLAELTPQVLARADLRRGRELYRATCHACHGLFGDGISIGPDLTGSNRGDIHYLLENILDPAAVVGIDYQLHILHLQDQRVLAGLVRGKTDKAITLQMAGGPETTVQLDEIGKHEISPGSMMPEGLLDNLSKNDIRDLIAYLRSPRQVPLPSPEEVLVGDESMKVKSASGGEAKPQEMGGFPADSWSAGRHLWWTGAKPGDKLELQFTAPSTRRYEVFGVFTKARDYGIVSISLNGTPVSDPIDLFDPTAVVTTGEILLGTHDLAAGSQTLGVEISGANPAAVKQHMFAIDHLRLVPVD